MYILIRWKESKTKRPATTALEDLAPVLGHNISPSCNTDWHVLYAIMQLGYC